MMQLILLGIFILEEELIRAVRTAQSGEVSQNVVSQCFLRQGELGAWESAWDLGPGGGTEVCWN
jgi:hypothetical protein